MPGSKNTILCVEKRISKIYSMWLCFLKREIKWNLDAQGQYQESYAGMHMHTHTQGRQWTCFNVAFPQGLWDIFASVLSGSLIVVLFEISCLLWSLFISFFACFVSLYSSPFLLYESVLFVCLRGIICICSCGELWNGRKRIITYNSTTWRPLMWIFWFIFSLSIPVSLSFFYQNGVTVYILPGDVFFSHLIPWTFVRNVFLQYYFICCVFAKTVSEVFKWILTHRH